MTPQERKLWYECLRDLPLRIHRQKMIGNYILDFYCAARKTAIELDGSQHFEQEEHDYDLIRDEYLSSLGITVLRYPNNEITSNFDGVCDDIMRKLALIP